MAVSNFSVVTCKGNGKAVKVTKDVNGIIRVAYHGHSVVSWDTDSNTVVTDCCGYPTTSTFEVIHTALSQIFGTNLGLYRRDYRFYLAGLPAYTRMVFEFDKEGYRMVANNGELAEWISGWSGHRAARRNGEPYYTPVKQ